MVDPLSIVSVLLTALTRSKDVCEYLSDIKNAPRHIRVANSNLRACRSALDKLRRFYNSSGRLEEHYPYGELDDLRAELLIFEETCRELDCILQPFKRRQRHGNGISLGTRIKWRWKKTEICELRDQLHQQQGNFALRFMHEIQSDRFPPGHEEPRRNARRIVQTVKKIRSDGSVSEHEDQELTERLEKHLRYKGSFADINDVRSEPSTQLDLPSNRSSLMLMSPALQPSMDGLLRAAFQPDLDGERRMVMPTIHITAERTRLNEGDSRSQRRGTSQHVLTQPPTVPNRLTAFDRQAGADLQILAPFDTNEPQTQRYRNVKDQQGRVIPMPIHEAPVQRSVRSAPGLLDLTRHMDEDQTRAFFTGYLRGSDERVEQSFRHIRSVGHLPQTRAPLYDILPSLQEIQDRESPVDIIHTPRPARATFSVHQDRSLSERQDQSQTAPERTLGPRLPVTTHSTQHPNVASPGTALRQRQSNEQNDRRTARATTGPKPVTGDDGLRRQPRSRQNPAGDENDYFNFVRSTRGAGLSTSDALQMQTSNIPEPPRRGSNNRDPPQRDASRGIDRPNRGLPRRR